MPEYNRHDANPKRITIIKRNKQKKIKETNERIDVVSVDVAFVVLTVFFTHRKTEARLMNKN